jgi:tRNA threonylcarbamoyladenosine biosynthesis protein TsaE
MSAAGDPGRGVLSFRSPTLEQTRAVAAELAGAWLDVAEGAGLVVGLHGGLGVGKTVFVKGLADGLGLDGDTVSSPTFVLANQYPVLREVVLNHVDFYRIELAAELDGMGFFDLMAPGALLAVEWADRFEHALPQWRLDVRVQRESEGVRRFEVRASGALPCAVVERWQQRAELDGG